MTRRIRRKKPYAAAKKILLIASLGAFIAGTLVFPNLPVLLRGKKLNFESFLFEDEWEIFDERRLKQRLKEMRARKMIKIYKIGNRHAVQITQKGRRFLLKYKLEDLSIPEPKNWDKKWRIVAYDIPKGKTFARNLVRKTLKKLGFMRLQKSVYIYPYPCTRVITFLREVFGVGEHVTLLTVGYLEDEEAYKEHFDL